jgi:Holliday junction resolvase RusA-like endonuclease
MKYKVVIDNWTSGLNELLNHQEKRYDPRTHRMRVYNTEKVKNERKIRSCLQKQGLDKVKLKTPIAIHYRIYAKDKKHDRMNLGSCLDKCFCDALQTMKILSNDGFDDVVEIRFDYGLDRNDPRAEITITEMQKVN